MTNRSVLLYNKLVLYGIDTIQARYWSQMPIGEPRTGKGQYLLNIPYLKKADIPDIGVNLVVQMEGNAPVIKLIDTLWNFREKE